MTPGKLKHHGWPAPNQIDAAQPIDWQSPLTRGLAAFWPTLLGTDNVLRGCGPLAGDLVAHNGASLSADPIVGLASSNFTGSTHRRYWSGPLAWPGGPVSVACWMYAPTASPTDGRSFFCNNSATWPNVFHGQIQPSAGTNSLFWDYGPFPGARLAAQPLFDQWMHVAFVSAAAAGDYMAIYINGKLAAEKFESYDVGAFSGVDLGRLGATNLPDNYYHTGRLAHFGIWHRVLSPAEIWSLWSPQTRWQMLRVQPRRRWFIPSGGPPEPGAGGFRLINGRFYRPGRLVA